MMQYCLVYLTETDGDLAFKLFDDVARLDLFVLENELCTGDYYVISGENLSIS